LALTIEEYNDLIARGGPLSDRTKQSAEINEEHHGKAILIFTVVTVIFLPLPFVTSYLGMNTSDIRDMENKQMLFWEIAIPLTVVVMSTILVVVYTGDKIKDYLDSIERSLLGKEDGGMDVRGISVVQRTRALRFHYPRAVNNAVSESTSDFKSLANDAEYAMPKPPGYQHTWDRSGASGRLRGEAARLQNLVKSSGTNGVVLPAGTRNGIHPQTRLPDRSRPTPEQDRVSIMPPTIKRMYEPLQRSDNAGADRPLGVPLSTVPPNGKLPFMRLHTKYVALQVLESACLPWHYDPDDADYIIVERYMNAWETDEVFEQSKRMAEANGERNGGDRYKSWRNDAWAYAGNDRRPNEYVWVSKKSKRRQRRQRRWARDDEYEQ